MANWVIRKNPARLTPTTAAKSRAVYCVNGLAMKMPALLTSVSMRPKLCIAVPMTCSAVSGSAMSPATVTSPSSLDGLIEREVAITR